MKIKHIITLVALALGLGSIGVAAPSIAGGRVGGGGDVRQLAGGNPTGHGGEWGAIADGDTFTLAGRKPGAASGSGAYTDAIAGSKGDQFSGRESN
jgi:hypothetical protein